MLKSYLQYYLSGVLLLLFLIPSIPLVLPAAIVLLTFAFLGGVLSGKLKANWSLLKRSWPLWGLFGLYAISLVYSIDTEEGMATLENKLSLLIAPVILLSVFYATEKFWRSAFLSFILGCSFAMVLCLIVASGNYYIDEMNAREGLYTQGYGMHWFISKRLSVFLHPSYLSMYLNVAMVFLVMEEAGHLKLGLSSLKRRLLLLFFTLGCILLISKAGVVVLLLILLLWTYTLMRKRNWIFIGFLIVIGSGFVIALSKAAPQFTNRISNFTEIAQGQDVDKDTKESTGVRVLIWPQASDLIMERPLLGHGVGDVRQTLVNRYKSEQIAFAAERSLNAHSQFLQTPLAIGFLGLFFLLMCFVKVWVSGMYRFPVAWIVALITAGHFTVESMLESQAGNVFFGFFFALFLYRNKRLDIGDHKQKKRIVILSQYFPPETGAPQNRLFELAVRLENEGNDVKVLTAMPNYPDMKVFPGYRWRFFKKESMDGLTVHRSWIFASKKKSVFFRLLNYFSFVWTSFWIGLFAYGRKDVLICESPPLFLGWTGWLLARLKGARFVFNVSDLWPESAEKLGIVSNKTFLGLAYRLEGFLYKRSALVTGQTQGICRNIEARFPHVRTYWLPNGVDLKLFDKAAPRPIKKELGIPDDHQIGIYAGILGYAQGLDVVLDAAKLLAQEKVTFVLFGDGPERERLEERIAIENIRNVLLPGRVTKQEMPSLVSASDFAVIPLRKLDLFLGAIPSKMFENLAMRKPIVLGVQGEAYDLFIENGKAGVGFEPDNASDLAEKVRKIIANPARASAMGEQGRKYVETYFDRDKQAADLSRELDTLWHNE